jgi:hypothetical protein
MWITAAIKNPKDQAKRTTQLNVSKLLAEAHLCRILYLTNEIIPAFVLLPFHFKGALIDIEGMQISPRLSRTLEATSRPTPWDD